VSQPVFLTIYKKCQIKYKISLGGTLGSGPVTSPAVSIPLTPIHFCITLTADNFTSEASKDLICPLLISKETRYCIKGSITLYLTLWPRRSRFCKQKKVNDWVITHRLSVAQYKSYRIDRRRSLQAIGRTWRHKVQ